MRLILPILLLAVGTALGRNFKRSQKIPLTLDIARPLPEHIERVEYESLPDATQYKVKNSSMDTYIIGDVLDSETSKMDEGVTVDISKHPGGDSVNVGGKGGYYYESGDKRIDLTVEDYPIKYGPYLKFTHTPEKGKKISKINKGGINQEGFPDLTGYASVSVYYWNGDYGFSKPLLIQLGTGDNEYYTNADKGTTWNKQSNITTGTLKKELNKQNCFKNRAHIIDLTDKKSIYTNYYCPGGCGTRIYLSTNSYFSKIFSTHTIPGLVSISGFRDNTGDQIGLPSLKNVSSVTVFWSKSGGIPLLIAHQNGWHNWYRRNAKSSKTWSEVSQYDRPTGPSDEDGNMQKLLQRNYYYPSIVIDLSRPTNATYSDKGTGIDITVRSTPIYGGYHMFEHSLKGGVFKATQVTQGQGNVLDGISSNEKLENIASFYLGDDPGKKKNLLLVEFAIKASTQTTYKYYQKENKNKTEWTELTRSDGETTRLESEDLKKELERLKKEHFPDTPDPSPVAPSSTSEFKDHDSISNKSTSLVGPAIGGTVCVLVTLAAMVLLIKFWPKVRTRFVGIWNGFGIHKKGELNM